MKKLIVILFITLFIKGFSQIRVPDTQTFSLQDVYNAVNDHANPTSDLEDCFLNAEESYFDPNHKDSKDRLYNFRNYGPDAVYITTAIPKDVTSERATLGGTITDYDDTITDYGFIVNENLTPLKGEHLTNTWEGEPPSLPHSFENRIYNFDSNTTFYVRAYATTTKKTFYGEVESFTTD